MIKRKTALKILLPVIFMAGLFFYPYQAPPPVKYIDRSTGMVKIEKVPAAFWLNWLYSNPLGELSLEALVKRKLVSEFYGTLMDKPSSAKKIEPFIKRYHINLAEAQKQHFKSFNDFFTRKLKPGARPVDTSQNVIVSPADGKVLAWQNIGTKDFIVKGIRFNLQSFLVNDSLARIFKNGTMLLFRLCPADYHRFHFPATGKIILTRNIQGDYYSVSPLAIKRMITVFCQNKRDWSVIRTEKFNDVIMSEIGATMVGSIIQTYKGNKAVKGLEKGYFKFGGSSIILLFKKGIVTVDSDLLNNTEKGLETTVKTGEHVASVTSNL